MSIDSLQVTIPLPSPIPRQRGRNATSDGSGTRLAIRFTKRERVIIEKQAELLGVTVSQFLRWCAVYTAVELEKRDAIRHSSTESN